MPFPTYNFLEFPGQVVDLRQLHEELKLVSFTTSFLGVIQNLEQVTVQFADVPSQDDIDLVDSIVLSHNYLRACKRRKTAKIDFKTQQLIESGFEFPVSSGVYFSLSVISQVKILGAYVARDEPEFVYPVIWNSLNDLQRVVIPDSDTLRSFFMRALLTYRLILDQGTALKSQVRNASSIAEVDAVVDDR